MARNSRNRRRAATRRRDEEDEPEATESPQIDEVAEPAEEGETKEPSKLVKTVLEELQLTDNDGKLEGAAASKVPEMQVLEEVKKHLEELKTVLSSGLIDDDTILDEWRNDGKADVIDKRLDELREAAGPTHRRHTIIKISGGGDGEKIEIKTEEAEEPFAKSSQVHAHDEDEEELPHAKRRRGIVLKANGERKEIRPAIEDDEDDFAGTEDELPSAYQGKKLEPFDIHAMADPAERALGLYNDEDAKASSSSELEYLRKKLAVADFPDDDLKSYLPGELPTKDLSVNRPSNQIAFSSFQNYVEPFFRDYTEDDLTFLRQKAILNPHLPKNFDDKEETFHIPRLGPLYTEVWREEDRTLAGGKTEISAAYMNDINHAAQKKTNLRMRQLSAPRGSSEDIDHDALEEDDKVSCGPLISRLLSALVGETSFLKNREEEAALNGVPIGVDGDDSTPVEGSSSALPGEDGHRETNPSTDYQTLDERLKRELNYIGVYMNVRQTLNDPGFDQDWAEDKEDDEICHEMRHLQRELKEVQRRNGKRKRVLIPVVEEQIAWQEYMSILEDLDKQVEQHYRRRINVTPKKSKKGRNSHHKDVKFETNGKEDSHLITSASFQSLLEKRAKWIEKVGPLFKSQKEMRQMPDESVFKDINEEENEDEENEDEEDEDVLAKNGDEEMQGESLELAE